MQLTPSFVELLQQFLPVFTSPTHLTFVQILTGWVLSHRHRYVTEVIPDPWCNPIMGGR